MNSRTESLSSSTSPVPARRGYSGTEVVLLGVGSVSAAALLLVLASAL